MNNIRGRDKDLSQRAITGKILFGGIVLSILVVSMICLLNGIRMVNNPFPGFLINQRMVLTDISRYGWTATEAGLRYPDKILKANDKIISSMKDLDEVVKDIGIGKPIRYYVDRKGRFFEATILTMQFTLTDLLMTFGIPFFAGIIYLLIGVIVFILKPHTKESWAFLLVCFSLSMYTITAFDNTLLFLVRINLLALALLPAAFIHLSLIFPQKKRLIERNWGVQLVPYIISALLAIPMIIIYPSPSFAPIYALTFFYLVIGSIFFLVSTLHAYLKRSSPLATQRAKVVLLGVACAFPIPTIILLVAVFGFTLGETAIQANFTALPILIFPASIAYAIAKHNLFDVDVYIKRTVGYVMMTIIVGMTYFGLQTVISTVILKPILGAKAESVYPVIFAILVVFFFNPLNHVVQSWVDRLFYRKKFDYKTTVASVSQALSSLMNLDEVIRQVIHTVRDEMFIDTTGIVLLEPKDRSCQTLFIGDSDNPLNNVKDQLKDVSINYDDPLLALLSREKKLITRYDIEEDHKYLDIRESCVQRFTEMGATLAIPMVHKNVMKGALVLGNKKSGHFYTREDIDLLMTLTSQGAVAIENARLFEENLEKQRMEDELRIAHDIQVSMLPEKSPEIEGFEIEGTSIPAKEVGGDFYDFIEIDSEEGSRKLGIVVGDVTGKGVSGALMMAASRSTYRVLAEQYSSVEELMGVGNRRLNKDIKKGMFVALLYAELNPRKSTLILSNAGQTQPILCPADRSIPPHYIDTEGDKFPLGIIKDCTYQETEVRLTSGDVVVFYTDGVVEAMNENGEMYGFERLMTSIEEGRGLGANAVMDKLMSDISGYVGGMEQHDDLTIVVVKMK